jgi:predicted transcriptional regulator
VFYHIFRLTCHVLSYLLYETNLQEGDSDMTVSEEFDKLRLDKDLSIRKIAPMVKIPYPTLYRVLRLGKKASDRTKHKMKLFIEKGIM